MHRKAFTLAVCLFLAASARDAAAQVPVGEPWTDRGYFNFNIGFDTGSSTLSDSRIYRLPNDAEFPEDGSLSFETAVDSGAMIDFAVGSRVWRNVSVGLGYHRGSNGNGGTVFASIPHPVNFNQHRNVTVPTDDVADGTEHQCEQESGESPRSRGHAQQKSGQQTGGRGCHVNPPSCE